MGSRVILGSDGLHLRPHWDRGENGRRGLFPGRPTPDLPAAGEGGKHHTVPAHHNAIEYVEDSLDAAGLWTTPRAPLFQSVARSRRQLNGRRLPEDNALQMIKRRAGRAAGDHLLPHLPRHRHYQLFGKRSGFGDVPGVGGPPVLPDHSALRSLRE